MKKINFGARPLDAERIALIRALCPDIDNTTGAIRWALMLVELHADQVQLEQARKAVKRNSREAMK